MHLLTRSAGILVAAGAVLTLASPGPIAAQASTTENVACGSSSGQRQTCRTSGTIANVDVVRDLSGNCRRNRTFGNSGSELWTSDGCRGDFRVRYRGGPGAPDGGGATATISCGRSDGAQVECRTGGYATDVRLLRNAGDVGCREGSNWGHTDSFIWTNRGCRGEFEVTFAANAGGGDGGNVGGLKPRVITCGSEATAKVSCNAFGPVDRVRMVRELSNRRCRQGSTWGFTSNDIWTLRGCRAEFEVTYLAAQPR